VGTALKGVARKALGEVLVHADILRRIAAKVWSRDISGKFSYRLHP
jgi:hypothetical protein